jgi:protein-tyrosine kinase
MKPSLSLIERAAEMYDFGARLRVPAPAPAPTPAPVPLPAIEPVAAPAPEPEALPEHEPEIWLEPADPAPWPEAPPERAAVPIPPRPRTSGARPVLEVDREALREAGFIVPEAPVTVLAEEFRMVKRQLLAGLAKAGDSPRARTLLVTSAKPDDGKSFCTLNLALSLAAERERELLLVDGDFAKPGLHQWLGLEGGAPGFIDAIADADADPESFVYRTDVPGLSLLPAGRRSHDVPELLASERTRAVIAALAEADPRRLILFDSPPVLMASAASVLSGHVGHVLLVVRADQTTEADLRETVALLSGSHELSLILNGAGFAASSRKFGSYYGYQP